MGSKSIEWRVGSTTSILTCHRTRKDQCHGLDLGASARNIDRGRFKSCNDGGCLESLRWMLQRHLIDPNEHIPSWTWHKAFDNDHVAMFDLMFELMFENRFTPTDEFVVEAVSSRRGVLPWAKKHNAGWNKQLCMTAAFQGDLPLLQWLRENGCPWDEGIIHSAQEGDHDEIVHQWAIENGCPRPIPN